MLQRKSRNITNEQFIFLLAWFNINDDKLFGFQGGLKFKEQISPAIKFYQETQKEWQERTLNNLTRLSFIEFFIFSALEEGILLVQDFNNRITEELKEVENELS